jgi:spermidine synthase
LEHLATPHALRPAEAAAPARHARTRLAFALMFASGACGLAWQMAWTAGFAVALGHEITALLAVLGAFFAGLAAGSLLLARRIERSPRPVRWYAGLEATVGLWGLAVVLLLPQLAAPLARWLGPQPPTWLHAAAAFALPFVLLLPATMAMGAALPALERQLRATRGTSLPLLYAGNTAGAVAGVLLAVFVALPAAGLQATAWACAAANLACAVTALLAWPRAEVQGGTEAASKPHAPWPRRLVLRLFATGLLGIGFEVLAVRVLAQVTENTVYTYALLLAAFLLATAGGAALWRRMAPAAAPQHEWADRLLLLLAAALLAGGVALWWADALQALPARWFGPSFATQLAGEALAGAAAMGPPALVMGTLFAVLCLQAGAARLPLGTALALNTLGCALAPALVGALLLPTLGSKAVLVLLGLGYVALASTASWRSPAPALLAAVWLALALLAPALRFIDVPPGGRLLVHREGTLATVSVVSDAEDVARLHINNRVQEGSSASGMTEIRLAQLPLLLHPVPREALFLGLGTGTTAHAAALDARVHVTAVELLPEVIATSTLFALRPGAPRAARPVDVVAADARRFVLASDAHYDVIVSDLFHPARSGAASLYTVEHFRAVRERLAEGGVFCQWLALHQMELGTLRSIVAAFLQVYPDGVAVLASNSLDSAVLGLIARPGAPQWQWSAVQQRLENPRPALAAALQQARVDSADAVIGAVIADSAALRAFAAGAQPNTDDHPLVAQQAARTAYAPEATPRERLAALLQAFPAAPAGVLAPADADAARLDAYWHARGRYLALGLQVQPHPSARVMLDRIGPQLLEIVRASPGFQPAAEALAGLARSIQGEDYVLSQRVLAALRQAQGRGVATPEPEPSQQP